MLPYTLVACYRAYQDKEWASPSSACEEESFVRRRCPIVGLLFPSSLSPSPCTSSTPLRSRSCQYHCDRLLGFVIVTPTAVHQLQSLGSLLIGRSALHATFSIVREVSVVSFVGLIAKKERWIRYCRPEWESRKVNSRMRIYFWNSHRLMLDCCWMCHFIWHHFMCNCRLIPLGYKKINSDILQQN